MLTASQFLGLSRLDKMVLIVGLGNPTVKYENTRHNVGFMLIDALKTPDFIDVSSAKFEGELFKFKNILLLKPQTFMNLSGKSVKAVSDFYKPSRIIVAHDDLDLAFGALKFKKGGSSGGHNGLKSIDELIGADYERVRIGIGRGEGSVSGFVLSEFSSEQKAHLEQILSQAKAAVQTLITSNISEISCKFSQKGIAQSSKS